MADEYKQVESLSDDYDPKADAVLEGFKQYWEEPTIKALDDILREPGGEEKKLRRDKKKADAEEEETDEEKDEEEAIKKMTPEKKFAMGCFFLLKNDMKRAAKYLTGNEFPEALMIVGRYLLSIGQPEQALKFFKKVLTVENLGNSIYKSLLDGKTDNSNLEKRAIKGDLRPLLELGFLLSESKSLEGKIKSAIYIRSALAHNHVDSPPPIEQLYRFIVKNSRNADIVYNVALTISSTLKTYRTSEVENKYIKEIIGTFKKFFSTKSDILNKLILKYGDEKNRHTISELQIGNKSVYSSSAALFKSMPGVKEYARAYLQDFSVQLERALASKLPRLDILKNEIMRVLDRIKDPQVKVSDKIAITMRFSKKMEKIAQKPTFRNDDGVVKMLRQFFMPEMKVKGAQIRKMLSESDVRAKVPQKRAR